MTPITTTEVDAFSKAEETTLVVVEAEVEVAQTLCLHKQNVDAVADEEEDAVGEVVLENFFEPTQNSKELVPGTDGETKTEIECFGCHFYGHCAGECPYAARSGVNCAHIRLMLTQNGKSVNIPKS